MGQDTLARRPCLPHGLGQAAGPHWPVSPLVWRVEWTPVSMGPLSSKGLGFRAKGDVWEGLRKVVGRHVGEEWEGPHRTVEGPQSLRSSTS